MSPSLSQKYASKAAVVVNENVARIATTLDRLGQQLGAGVEGAPANSSFGPAVAQQLNRASQRLTAIQGDAVVEKAKDQITRHPSAVTIAGALTGAAVVQLAILAMRREQKLELSDRQVERDVPTSIRSDAL